MPNIEQKHGEREKESMRAKKVKPKRTCADCIHEFACAIWNVGGIHNMDATHCTGFESVRDSAAYLCGVLDERRRVIDADDYCCAKTDPEALQ